MTLEQFKSLCEGYGLKIRYDIFYQALDGNYCLCDYSSKVQKAYMYTDKGIEQTTSTEQLRSYLDEKMLVIKQRKMGKRLAKMENDFD